MRLISLFLNDVGHNSLKMGVSKVGSGSFLSSKMVSSGLFLFLGVFEKSDLGFFWFYGYNLEVSMVGVRLSRRFSTSILSTPRSNGI